MNMTEDQNQADIRRASVGQMSYCSMENECKCYIGRVRVYAVRGV